MKNDQEQVRMVIDTGSVMKAALALTLLYVLFLLRDLVLVVLTAVMIASAVEPAKRWLVGRKIPRILAVLTVYVVTILFLFVVFYFLVPPLLSETASFLRSTPQYLNSLTEFESFPSLQTLENFNEVQGFTGDLSLTTLVSDLSSYISRVPGGIFNAVSAIFGGAFSFILIVVISFYLSVQEKGIENFLGIVTPQKHQDYALNLWRRSQAKIGRWMQGQLLLMLIVTVLVYLGLTILGVRHAFLFALLAGMFELIPLFGPILASIPAIVISFVDGGLAFAAIVAGVYVIIQQFENQLIYPLVVHKVVGVPALIVILALIIGGQLAGFLGIILAVPAAAVLMELTGDIEKRNKGRLTKVEKT